LDNRIKTIHKSNEGLVAARKTGVNMASGEYIGFVDGDDRIESDFYSQLCAAAVEHNSDVVAAGYSREFLGKIEVKSNNIKCNHYDGAALENMRCELISVGEIYTPGIFTYVWNKLFKRNVLTNFQNAVPDVITVGEDAAVVFPIFAKCGSITVIDNHSYIYRQHVQSMIKQTEWSNKNIDGVKGLVAYLQSSVGDEYKSKINDFLLHLFLIHSGSRIGNEFVSDVDLSNKLLILYSGGTFGQYIMKGSASCGLDFVGWVDDDVDECRTCGLDVDSVQSIKEMQFDYVLIATTSNALSQKIGEELSTLCVQKEKIVYYCFTAEFKNELFTKYLNYYGVAN
ncbi:MAG: glycosyltransferase, partial [Clostridiales bacterium]|nr:glycosyltransferase [Clostridiales bacterium]